MTFLESCRKHKAKRKELRTKRMKVAVEEAKLNLSRFCPKTRRPGRAKAKNSKITKRYFV